MDINNLLQALDNNKNENIIDLDNIIIAKRKNDILQQLGLSRTELIILQKKLKKYRYIDGLKDLQFGNYIRWMNLKNPEIIKLTNGGIICDIKELNNDIHIYCKNNINRIFQIKLSEVIIFQKLNNQENVILQAIKYLE
jgi:hypothetical protein